MYKVYINNHQSAIQITDIGSFEILPMQTISVEDYPSLKKSLQFQHFVAKKLLVGEGEEESKEDVKQNNYVQPFVLNQNMSKEDIAKIAEQIIEYLNSHNFQISNDPNKKLSHNIDEGQMEIINHMLSSLPMAEQYGSMDNENENGEENDDNKTPFSK